MFAFSSYFSFIIFFANIIIVIIIFVNELRVSNN